MPTRGLYELPILADEPLPEELTASLPSNCTIDIWPREAGVLDALLLAIDGLLTYGYPRSDGALMDRIPRKLFSFYGAHFLRKTLGESTIRQKHLALCTYFDFIVRCRSNDTPHSKIEHRHIGSIQPVRLYAPRFVGSWAESPMCS